MKPLSPVQAASEALAGALRKAAFEAGATQVDIANRLWGPKAPSRRVALVGKWFDPEDPHQMPAAYIPLLEEFGVRITAWLATEQGYSITAEEEDHHGDDHMGRLHSLLKECSDVTVTYSAAMQDGHISRAERAQMLTEIREAREALRRAEVTLGAEERASN